MKIKDDDNASAKCMTKMVNFKVDFNILRYSKAKDEIYKPLRSLYTCNSKSFMSQINKIEYTDNDEAAHITNVILSSVCCFILF